MIVAQSLQNAFQLFFLLLHHKLFEVQIYKIKRINVTAKFIAIAFMVIVIVVVSVALLCCHYPHCNLRWRHWHRQHQHHHHHHCVHLSLMDWKVVLLIETSMKDEIKFKKFQLYICVCVRAKWQMCPFKLKYEIMSTRRQWRWQWDEVCVCACATANRA